MKKRKLEVLISMVREYWDELTASSKANQRKLNRISEYQAAELPKDRRISEFLQVILGHNGINPEATNEEICNALEALGWEVK